MEINFEPLYRALLLIFLLLSDIGLLCALWAFFRRKRHFTIEVVMSDTSLVINNSAIATAVILDSDGNPTSAVFDAAPGWAKDNESFVFTGNDFMSVVVTGAAVGSGTLTVAGHYQGVPLTNTAVITVTEGSNGFSVNIEWSNPPTP